MSSIMLDPVALDYIDFLTPYLKFVKDWQLHFCWLPHRCILTGKILWLKDCYRGSRHSDVYYIEKHEFILWSLKT